MGLEFIDVVRFRNQLDDFDFGSGLLASQLWASSVSDLVSASGIKLYGHDTRVARRAHTADAALKDLAAHIEVVKKDLDTWIRREEGELLQISEDSFYPQFQNTLPSRILERRLNVDDQSDQLFRDRIKLYANWRQPGMILRPGLETHIQDMVAMDPLYVVDHAWHLIEPAMSSFNEHYRARLRPYTVLDTSEEIFAALPKSVFGLIVAYNFFNFKPATVIDRYLSECWSMLCPGGVLIMTYNDCDRAHGLGLMESGMGCYTPGRMIKNSATRLGYEIVAEFRSKTDLVWAELRRPGDTPSIRGAQTLAKIVERSK